MGAAQCGNETCHEESGFDAVTLGIPPEDGQGNQVGAQDAADQIVDAPMVKDPAPVYCYACSSPTVCVVMAHLLKYGGLARDQACEPSGKTGNYICWTE